MTKRVLRTLTLGCAALALACASSAYAKKPAIPPHLVDASDFDIAGVKIGMDFDQALKAVVKQFNVAPGEIIIDPEAKSDCPLDNNKGIKVITMHGAQHPTLICYKKDNVSLTVSFETRIPIDKARPAAVWQVRYAVPGGPILGTEVNVAAMKEAALAKYGEPTYDGRLPRLGVGWCAKVDSLKSCSPKDQVRLRLLDGFILVLDDPRLQSAANQYRRDLRDSKLKATPKF